MGKSSACSSASSSAACFLPTETARDNSGGGGCSSSREISDSDPPGPVLPGGMLNAADISALDSAGAVVPFEIDRPKIDRRTADDVWREIMARKKIQHKQPKEEMMTLEEFLLQAGAVEDATTASTSADVVGVVKEEEIVGEDSCSGMGVGGLDVGLVRGKRSSISLDPSDKAALQRQKRMIKNRESAARSRERKQAYQVELETMAMRLEEENFQLLQDKAERAKKRLKQLMENVIPLTEKQTSSRLKRVNSTEW